MYVIGPFYKCMIADNKYFGRIEESHNEVVLTFFFLIDEDGRIYTSDTLEGNGFIYNFTFYRK